MEKVRREKLQVREQGGKARNSVFFYDVLWLWRVEKYRLAKAAGAETSAQMRNEKLHTVAARSTF